MKYKKGDLVRVKTFKKRPRYWNSNGLMDYLMGEVVKIERIKSNNAGFYVKDLKSPITWYLEFKDVEPVEKCVEIYQSGNKIIAKNKITGKQAIARCNTKEDTFDFMIGANLALERLGKMETEIQVGDIVKIIDTKKMYTTSTDLVRDLANGNVSIMLRYAYTVSPYSQGLKQLEDEFRVIAKDEEICLVEVYYSKDFHGGEVFAIDVEGLELCERGK